MTDPPPSRPRGALVRHRGLVASMVAVVAGFVTFGLATGSDLSLPYAGIIAAGGLLVAVVEPDEGFSTVVLAGLVLWAVGHLAGGTIGIGEGRTLYNAVLPGGVHADNVVHFVGFGTAGLAWWEATSPWLRPRAGHALGVAVSVWLAGMGVGAFNEVFEFFATLVLPETNVGGYHNTGRDLVANLLGAGVAGVIAARRQMANSHHGEGGTASGSDPTPR